MAIKLFDIQGGKVIPTEHCYTLRSLKLIMDAYPQPEDYMAVYAYIFYMTCPDDEINPFFNLPENEKEQAIYLEVNGEFSPEDPEIIQAILFCNKLYNTPTLRAFNGMKAMLDKLAHYLYTTNIEHGRDGNIAQIIQAAAKFDSLRTSFKGVYKDLQEEQKSLVRGGISLAYDQRT